MNPRLTQRIAFAILLICTLIVIVPVLLIVAMIIKNGAGAISWEFLTTMPRAGMKEGGIFPAIVGTLCLVFGAVLFALPLGVFASVYLTEYARDNYFTRLVKLAIVNLAGVPSVIYGLFGLGLFVTFLHFGTSIISGSLTLGIMILPVIITASERESANLRISDIRFSLSPTEVLKYKLIPASASRLAI